MNLLARIALTEVIEEWALKFKLSPEEEIDLLEKQLALAKAAWSIAREEKTEEKK